MQHMKANDALDTLFVQLQNKLNSEETAPCERTAELAGKSCLSHDWGSYRGAARFFYAPEAARFVAVNFCAPCKASWFVAVARNLMFGVVS
jgi:hypothetical protein